MVSTHARPSPALSLSLSWVAIRVMRETACFVGVYVSLGVAQGEPSLKHFDVVESGCSSHIYIYIYYLSLSLSLSLSLFYECTQVLPLPFSFS